MIQLVKVKDKAEGQVKVREILKKIIDPTTLLALSGGTSVDYQLMLVQAGDIIPGAICVVDERYGEPFHENSNEKLLADAGVKKFADENCIETHKILKGKGFSDTAKIYDTEIKGLFARFPKRVGVMGVGANLHTAGIFPNSGALKSADFVVGDNVNDVHPKRITLTLKALEEFTGFVVMMFGSPKQNALRIMLDESEDDMDKYPAVFYRKSKIKSFVITDINI